MRGRKRALLVITDGASSDRVRRPASRLRRDGVEMFSLGVGSGYRRSQLQLIASSALNIFTAGFSRLGKVVKAINEKVCQPVKPTPRRKFHFTLRTVLVTLRSECRYASGSIYVPMLEIISCHPFSLLVDKTHKRLWKVALFKFDSSNCTKYHICSAM